MPNHFIPKCINCLKIIKQLLMIKTLDTEQRHSVNNCIIWKMQKYQKIIASRDIFQINCYETNNILKVYLLPWQPKWQQ